MLKYHIENTQRVIGKLLVAGKRLNLGIRGPGEKPSWGETRSVGTGGSHPGQESWSISGGEAHVPQWLFNHYCFTSVLHLDSFTITVPRNCSTVTVPLHCSTSLFHHDCSTSLFYHNLSTFTFPSLLFHFTVAPWLFQPLIFHFTVLPWLIHPYCFTSLFHRYFST